MNNKPQTEQTLAAAQANAKNQYQSLLAQVRQSEQLLTNMIQTMTPMIESFVGLALDTNRAIIEIGEFADDYAVPDAQPINPPIDPRKAVLAIVDREVLRYYTGGRKTNA